MSVLQLLLVGLGGAAGAMLRAGLTPLIPAGRLPWGTVVVNLAGAFALGWLMARLGPAGGSGRTHALLATGFCGGFTTFSAFSWQLWEQVRGDQFLLALGHALLAVCGCVVATALGWRLGRL